MKNKAGPPKTVPSKNPTSRTRTGPGDPKEERPTLSDLRQRAEEQVHKKEAQTEELSPAEATRLIHELRVYQMELEMQNEELRLSQDLLEESRSKYADLYDFAPLPVQTIIYRVFQEALTNIGKHAYPTAVNISCKKEKNRMQCVIQDNGAGFNPAELDSGARGRRIGLVAMEERLHMVGGSFEIQSRKQRGARLTFSVPIPPPEKKPDSLPPKGRPHPVTGLGGKARALPLFFFTMGWSRRPRLLSIARSTVLHHSSRTAPNLASAVRKQ